MSAPHTEQIPRRGRGTGSGEEGTILVEDQGPASWAVLADLLRAGRATTWLSVPSRVGVHTRPVFAAWTGETFLFASNAGAAKARHLDAGRGRVSLALDLSSAHLVVEGDAARVTDTAGLERAVTAMQEVYGWPTTVHGDQLDAPYAAPTSGGPPFNVYEVTPVRAFAFPTDDGFEPTRFTW